MKISINKPPPSAKKIQESKRHLEIELCKVQKYYKRIAIAMFGAPVIAAVAAIAFLILFVLYLAYSYDPDYFAQTSASVCFVALLCIYASGSVLDRIEYRGQEISNLIGLVSHVDSGLFPEVLELCRIDDDIRRYQNKLVTINRPMIHAEYLAIKKWKNNEKKGGGH